MLGTKENFLVFIDSRLRPKNFLLILSFGQKRHHLSFKEIFREFLDRDRHDELSLCSRHEGRPLPGYARVEGQVEFQNLDAVAFSLRNEIDRDVGRVGIGTCYPAQILVEWKR